MENNKRLVVLISILVLAAFAAGAYAYMSKYQSGKKQEITNTQPEKPKPTPVVKKLENNQSPKGLAADIPVDADVQVLQNYEATSSSNGTQGTKKFTTEKTLDAAVKTYTDYFTKEGWTQVDKQADTGYISVVMKRKTSTLLIFASYDKNLNKNVVELTITEQK